MSKTQAALQRRLGRLSMLIDIAGELLPSEKELVAAMKREMELLREISMRLDLSPELPHQEGERPPVTSRRP